MRNQTKGDLMDEEMINMMLEPKPKKKVVKKKPKKNVSNKKTEEKTMDDIKKFMDELQSKPNGTTMKRNGLEIKKDNQFEYGIYYMKKGFGNEYSRQNYLSASKSRIIEALYNIETGIIKMIDGVLVDTRHGETTSFGSRKHPEQEFDLF